MKGGSGVILLVLGAIFIIGASKGTWRNIWDAALGNADSGGVKSGGVTMPGNGAGAGTGGNSGDPGGGSGGGETNITPSARNPFGTENQQVYSPYGTTLTQQLSGAQLSALMQASQAFTGGIGWGGSGQTDGLVIPASGGIAG